MIPAFQRDEALLEDIAAGKGIVKRRTDDNVFVKGKTIAATPGSVVYQSELFQLIQYNPTTDKVPAEPLPYVPPPGNRLHGGCLAGCVSWGALPCWCWRCWW